MIAALNNPSEPGATRWSHTDIPPADSPAIVTLSGSPPNPAMLSLHPSQRGLLIGQAVIADIARRAERRMREEAQRTQPVVDRHDDDVAAARQPAGVVDVAAAVDEPAAVNPHQNRSRLARRRWRPHIERQAVLAGLAFVDVAVDVLDASWAGTGGITKPAPTGHRVRRLKAQRSHRRCGIRDSGEEAVI